PAQRVDLALHGADFSFDAAQVAADGVDRAAVSGSQNRFDRETAPQCSLVAAFARLFEAGLVQFRLQPPPPSEEGSAGRTIRIALPSAQHGQLLVDFSIGTFHGNTSSTQNTRRMATRRHAEPRQTPIIAVLPAECLIFLNRDHPEWLTSVVL